MIEAEIYTPAMHDEWNSFVARARNATFPKQVVCKCKHLQDIFHAGFVIDEKPAIGKPLMRPYSVAINIQRQQGSQVSLAAEHY